MTYRFASTPAMLNRGGRGALVSKRGRVVGNYTHRKPNKGKSMVRPYRKIRREIVPNIHNVKLPYCSDIFIITATSGIPNYHLFNLNNIFDPDRTAAGHSPLGRDQWAAFYNQYRVTGAKVSVMVYNYTNEEPIIVSMGAIPGTAGTADGFTAKESPRFITRYGGNDNKPVKLTKYWSLPQAFGITNLQYNADKDYSGVIGSAPVLPACLQIWAGPMDGGTTVNMKVEVKIEYYTRFTNPAILAQS